MTTGPIQSSPGSNDGSREPSVGNATQFNRREFLTYSWGVALGLSVAGTTGVTYVFALPRFRSGEFGGLIHLGIVGALPAAGTLPPALNTDGHFWLSHTDDGIKALYVVCTHLGCLYKWSESNTQFECPCHGSKFTAEGDYIEGPAPRSLDQFEVEIVEGNVVVATTEETGERIIPPQATNPALAVVVNTGRRILGKPASTSPARDSEQE